MALIFLTAALLSLPHTVPPQNSAQSPKYPAFTARIERLFHTIVTTEDESLEAAGHNEVQEMYAVHGFYTVAEVGDEAAYEFVTLLSSEKLAADLRTQILSKVKDAGARGDVPSDAVIFYEARLRIENAKKAAEAHAPTNPELRDKIESMSKVDQAVREQQGFDAVKMEATDRANAAPLQAILNRYGVPTFATVGPQAAGDFVLMILHQPPEFRRQVLEKVKVAVDAGQADPESYAKVYDRSQSDLGQKQLYGEQLICNAGEKMHEAPIEDEAHVNQRRAELGLIRVEIYARIAAEMMPQFCPGS